MIDVELLKAVESKKTARKSIQHLFKEVEKKTRGARSDGDRQAATASALSSFYTSSLQRFALLNFLFSSANEVATSSAKSLASVQRFDLQQTMSSFFGSSDSNNEQAAALWSHLVYQIEPVMSADTDRYWQNSNDLSVSC